MSILTLDKILRGNNIISYSCKLVMPYCEIVGDLFLTESKLCFVANEKNSLYLMV